MHPLKAAMAGVSLAFLLSCHSDDPEPKVKNCRPESLHSSHAVTFDSVQYVYLASGRLEKLLYYDIGKVHETDRLEYDAQGKLVTFTRKYETWENPFNTFKFFYNAIGRIEKMHTWTSSSTADPPLETIFTYDSQGRLVIKKEHFYQTRFEYSDEGNVKKVFYTSNHEGDETLGKENHSFDTRPRFFANVPDLATINIYVFGYEPSKNNNTSTTIYLPYPGTTFGVPQNVSLNLEYNDDDMVTNNTVDPWLIEGLTEITFKKIRYTCQ